MSIDNPVVAVVAGPTASGKSWLAAHLAQRTNGVVINADSLQLYNALPILTARPGPELTALAPHRLYGAFPPSQRSTAASWARAAGEEIERAHRSGNLPIVVGGGGLYLEALMHGLADLPEIPVASRQQAAADLQSLGREAFFARLIAADPACERLKPGDTQRILRAWEVYSATGRTLTDWQAVPAREPDAFTFVPCLILPPRDVQRWTCDRRFLEMIEQGAQDEVAAFLDGPDAASTVTQALGFAPLALHLRGEISLEEAIARGQAETRQYAKRQSTWFRNRFRRLRPDASVFEAMNEASPEIVAAHLRGFNHE